MFFYVISYFLYRIWDSTFGSIIPTAKAEKKSKEHDIMRQELKDRSGHKIGEIRDEGSKQIIYDQSGHRLGYFDGRYTYDQSGRRIGEGNLLTTLLVKIGR